MFNKYKSFLYTLDLIGPSPQLLIFNDKRYKSIFSSLFSILIILFSIFFILYSFIEYSKFDNPFITYYKDNDEITNRTIQIKDTLLIFGIMDSSYSIPINNSEVYYDAYYYEIYFNGTSKQIQIPLVLLNGVAV